MKGRREKKERNEERNGKRIKQEKIGVRWGGDVGSGGCVFVCVREAERGRESWAGGRGR